MLLRMLLENSSTHIGQRLPVHGTNNYAVRMIVFALPLFYEHPALSFLPHPALCLACAALGAELSGAQSHVDADILLKIMSLKW